MDKIVEVCQKFRRKDTPAVPNDVFQLGEVLSEYDPMKEYYRGMVTTKKGKAAHIFITKEMEKPLSECTELYMDGAVKVKK